MEQKCILVRYGEIYLKGKNRFHFEKKLVRNIKACLKSNNIPFKGVKRLRNRIIIYTNNKCSCLKYVFGIINYSPVIKTESDMDSIKKVTLKLIKNLKSHQSFRVSAKNLSNKKISSMEINKEIGSFIQNQTKAKVSLENFDFELGIEIIDNDAYIFNQRVACFGGLPVGVEGRVLSLIEDKKSILASILMMKRGCDIFPVSLKKTNISILKRYCSKINLIKIKSIKDIENIAEKLNINTLVINQTLKDFKDIKTNLLILRPLISFSEEEIELLHFKALISH